MQQLKSIIISMLTPLNILSPETTHTEFLKKNLMSEVELTWKVFCSVVSAVVLWKSRSSEQRRCRQSNSIWSLDTIYRLINLHDKWIENNQVSVSLSFKSVIFPQPFSLCEY